MNRARRARAGRRPGGADTREEILVAARAVFAEHGYDRGTVRLVAATAAVDPALIYHYFDSKQQLFVAAMDLTWDWEALLPAIAEGPRHEMGERLVRTMLGLWEDPDVQPRFLGVVRAAVTDPGAAELVRALLTEGPIPILGRAIGTPDGGLRAMLAASHVMGLALLRYILRVEPLASADVETLVAIVGPTVDRYLTGSAPAR